MAAPTPTARVAPAGIRLDDGYRSTITFASKPAVFFWELEVTPPGVDGGKPIDTTTMWNNSVESMAPQGLYTLTDSQMKVGFDPGALTDILSLVNKRGEVVTVTFKDGTTWAFFGYLQSFKPAAMVRGKMPEAVCVIQPTDVDATGTEQLPVLTNVAGT